MDLKVALKINNYKLKNLKGRLSFLQAKTREK